MIYNILNNKPLPIYSKEKFKRMDLCDDHCEALLKLYFKGKKVRSIILDQELIVVTLFSLKNFKCFHKKKLK